MGGGPTIKPNQSFVDGTITIRDASRKDLEAIAWIMTAAYPDDSACDYIFPKLKEYPEDFAQSQYDDYVKVFDRPEKYFCMVACAPVVNENGQVRDKPIAVAIWDFEVLIEDDPETEDKCRARDDARSRAFLAAKSRIKSNYFAPYGSAQIYLDMMYTHPDFRRRGAATRLINWGIAEAERRSKDSNAGRDYVVSVCGSPMGRVLYASMGFVHVRSEWARVGDEERTEEAYGMIRE